MECNSDEQKLAKAAKKRMPKTSLLTLLLAVQNPKRFFMAATLTKLIATSSRLQHALAYAWG